MEDFSDTNAEASDKLRQSKYNSAIAQLYRLDDLFKDAHKHSRNTLYAKWNEDLDRLWLELIPNAKPEFVKKIDTINETLAKLFIYSSTELLRKRNPIFYSKLVNMQKKALMEKEHLLRQALESQGKGSAFEDELDDYMD